MKLKWEYIIGLAGIVVAGIGLYTGTLSEENFMNIIMAVLGAVFGISYGYVRAKKGD